MQTNRIVVVGASAGGIEALRTLVAGLPADFPLAICIVLHTSPGSPGVLDAILTRAGHVRAVNARDGERIKPGLVYVAPPDCHLIVEPGRLRVTKGPRENRFRPAIDPLFRSAAQVYGPGAIGVVLTGNLDDGTAGLWAVKQLGGTAIVQDPDDALFPDMPRSALQHVRVDHVRPLEGIAPLLVELTSESAVAEARAPIPRAVEVEVKIAMEENALQAGIRQITEPSTFACPECHGVLLQLSEGGRVRFRCHTGHAYSLESLLAAISEGIEAELWRAIRALEEGEMLMRLIAGLMRTHSAGDAEVLIERAEEAKRQASAVRKLAMEREPVAAKPSA